VPVLHITEENFNSEVMNSELPVLVVFWAEWCAPCRMFSPVIEEVISGLEGKMKIGKVNIDESPELAERFGVSTIPTLILFRDVEVVNRWTGAMSKEELLEKLSRKLL